LRGLLANKNAVLAALRSYFSWPPPPLHFSIFIVSNHKGKVMIKIIENGIFGEFTTTWNCQKKADLYYSASAKGSYYIVMKDGRGNILKSNGTPPEQLPAPEQRLRGFGRKRRNYYA